MFGASKENENHLAIVHKNVCGRGQPAAAAIPCII